MSPEERHLISRDCSQKQIASPNDSIAMNFVYFPFLTSKYDVSRCIGRPHESAFESFRNYQRRRGQNLAEFHRRTKNYCEYLTKTSRKEDSEMKSGSAGQSKFAGMSAGNAGPVIPPHRVVCLQHTTESVTLPCNLLLVTLLGSTANVSPLIVATSRLSRIHRQHHPFNKSGLLMHLAVHFIRPSHSRHLG